MWAAVKNVAHYVKMIYGHALYQLAEREYESIGAVKVNYARYYAFIIHLFVELDIMGVEKLVNYVSKVGRESFSDLGAGIF